MDLKLTDRYVEEITNKVSSQLVGKILKRFEIIDEKALLKITIKELIYEEFRNARDLLIAGGVGLEQRQFVFKKKG